MASRESTGRSYVISSGRCQFSWSIVASPICHVRRLNAVPLSHWRRFTHYSLGLWYIKRSPLTMTAYAEGL